MGTTLADQGAVAAVLDPASLALRGAVWPAGGDQVPALAGGVQAGTLLLFGWTGGVQWPAFTASDEYRDRRPDPLDRWTRRLLGAAAARLGGRALYPGEGPPFLPFQRWAMQAEGLVQSPLGLLIHPVWGLWHAYRGAIALAERLDLVEQPSVPAPCDACARPCLAACPVGAIRPGVYDIAACAGHLAAPASQCPSQGCAARQACPVRPPVPYGAAQLAFHMAALRVGLRRHIG